MALPDIFSRRNRAASRNGQDVYVYDDFPQKVRIQIVHIVREAVGPDYFGYSAGPSAKV